MGGFALQLLKASGNLEAQRVQKRNVAGDVHHRDALADQQLALVVGLPGFVSAEELHDRVVPGGEVIQLVEVNGHGHVLLDLRVHVL